MTSQLQQCRDFAAGRGWTISDEYVDNDISAYSGVTRPEFERLLTDMAAGTTTHVIAWHIDRLARRVADLVRITEAAKGGGVSIHTVKAGDIDLSNSSGEFMAHLLGAVAQFEARHMSERQVASRADRAQRGIWAGGRFPFGYSKGDNAGELVIHPEHAALVQRWTTGVLNGEGIMKLARETREEYADQPDNTLSELTAVRLKKRLLTPAIAGLAQLSGEVLGEGSWPAIIPREQWETVKAILTNPDRRTSQGGPRKWQGSGVYECGVCGGFLAHRNMRRKNKLLDGYYCKENECVSILREPLEDFVDGVVVGYLSKPENQIKVIDSQEKSGAEAAKLHRERAELVERKDALGRYFAEGTIDGSALSQGSRRLKTMIDEIDRKLGSMRTDAPLLDAAMSGDGLRDRWAEMSADRRAEVIRALMRVKVERAPRRRVPAPERVTIEWK